MKAAVYYDKGDIRVESSFFVMIISRPYRVKNLPRLPGAFEPWIALWQLRHARVTRRLFTLGLG